MPISRYDMADYLALSVETVGRSLTGLKARGLISFMGTRNIKIVNRAALEDGPHIPEDGTMRQALGRTQRLTAA